MNEEKFLEVAFLMAKITKEQVERIADLAHLAVTEEEVAMYTEQLQSIVTFANQLSELNTDDVKATTHVLHETNVMREDIPKQSITQEEALKNAPDKKDGYFKVPSILE